MAKLFPAGITPVIITHKDYTKEGGEILSYEHTGASAGVEADYNTYKTAMIASTATGISSL